MSTILIADDHPLFREALRGAVQRILPGATLCEADSVDALYGLVEAHADADLLLMDLNMPGAHGFNALVHLRALHPQLPVVVVSAREEPSVMRRALDHGALGFIPKSADSDTIGEAVGLVLDGERWAPAAAAAAPAMDRDEQAVAQRLREDLHSDRPPRNEQRLQDRYSLRCAPHVIGVLEDALPFLRQLIETELNSANDNPLIDPEREQILHGSHFYGGHIAFAMDSLKNTVANVADLLDRQLALIVDARYNHGLPANLSGATGSRAAINHGLKALQISVSAWTAEALKLTMPASVFSRSTECHNQDKVSMGTIAARDCLRVIELTTPDVMYLIKVNTESREAMDEFLEQENDSDDRESDDRESNDDLEGSEEEEEEEVDKAAPPADEGDEDED